MASRPKTRATTYLTNNQLAVLYTETKCPTIRAKVAEVYDTLVIHCARNYSQRSDHADIVQEGRIALLEALERYDPGYGRFSTIAVHYIKGKLSHYMRDKSSHIKVPTWIQDHYRKERLARSALEAAFGKPPTDLEVAQTMNIPLSRLYEIHNDSPETINLTDFSAYTDNDENIKPRKHPRSMIHDPFGSTGDNDDLIDYDTKLMVRTSSVTTLMKELRITLVTARKLKEYVH